MRFQNIITYILGVPTSIGFGIEAATAQLNFLTALIGLLIGIATLISLFFIVRINYYKLKHSRNQLIIDENQIQDEIVKHKEK